MWHAIYMPATKDNDPSKWFDSYEEALEYINQRGCVYGCKSCAAEWDIISDSEDKYMSEECNICNKLGHAEAKCPQASPGSKKARDEGCTCPVVDNHYGAGFPFNGEISFWIREDCPLHGEPKCT
jgi:hypothetical protein